MINLISRTLNQPSTLSILAGSTKNTKNQLSKLFLIQCNNICHKNDLDPEIVKMRYPPFPYKTKPLNYFHKYWKLEGFNPTLGKFTENTKVVVVEGNIGSGKNELAKKLADDLGMKYWGDISADLDYKTDDGFDYRDLNIRLHKDVWYPDFKSVLETKNPFQAASWEISVLRLRCYHYLAGLTEMMNTGDGIVFERSPWTGTVFARTLRDLNIVSNEFLEHYWEVRSAAFQHMFRPHVVIYLDVPVDKCLENARIKNSHGCGHLLDEEYLETVEHNYKKHFLPIIEGHAEVFTYNLNKPVTEETASDLSELIVDELGQSDMDEYFMRITSKTNKFEDWRFWDSDERLQELRFRVTQRKKDILAHFEFYPYYVDELWPAYSLLFARNFVTENAEEKREEELYKKYTVFEKMFGKKQTFDDKDQDEWLVKTGYPLDHYRADQ